MQMATKKKVKEPEKTNRGRIPQKVLDGIISDLKNGLNTSDVAEKYDRPIEQILRVFDTYVKPYLTTSSSGNKHLDIIAKFKERPEWTQFNAEFSKDEMEMFMYEYCKLMDDFGEDEVRKAEENQLFMSIRYWILIHRNMKDRKKTDVELEELEAEIKDVIRKGPEDKKFGGDFDKYSEYRRMLEDRKNVLRGSQTSKTSEHKTLTEKHQKFMEDLKVTRNQRIERFEQKKSSINFLDVIKELQVEENRKAIGLQMEMVKESMNKQEREWGKIHQFTDGELDRLVVDSDTIQIEEYADDAQGEMEIHE